MSQCGKQLSATIEIISLRYLITLVQILNLSATDTHRILKSVLIFIALTVKKEYMHMSTFSLIRFKETCNLVTNLQW